MISWNDHPMPANQPGKITSSDSMANLKNYHFCFGRQLYNHGLSFIRWVSYRSIILIRNAFYIGKVASQFCPHGGCWTIILFHVLHMLYNNHSMLTPNDITQQLEWYDISLAHIGTFLNILCFDSKINQFLSKNSMINAWRWRERERERCTKLTHLAPCYTKVGPQRPGLAAALRRLPDRQRGSTPPQHVLDEMTCGEKLAFFGWDLLVFSPYAWRSHL